MGAFKLKPPQKNLPSERKFPYIDSELNEGNYIEQEMLLQQLTTQPSEDGESLWLLSYSDMMTLLFGLFVLLIDATKKER